MLKRSSKSHDFVAGVRAVVENSIDETLVGGPLPDSNANKNPAAVALGKLGGRKGGLARAAKLTPEQRREIARKAANARYGNKNK